VLRKLFVTGRTLAVGIPGAAAAELGLEAGQYVEVEWDAAAALLLVSPAGAARRTPRPAYVEQVTAFLAEYGAALAALEET
jgi:antitoxin component of MazEF toxin-antitoxin module